MPVTGRLADAVADHRAGPRPLGELPAVPGAEVSERWIPGAPGAPRVRVRIYRPAGAGAGLPAVVWIHGGGFVLGNVDSVHHSAAQAAVFASAVVVAVSYRLAPEDPFPAGLDDCWAALEWTAGNAAEIGADPGRLAVAGASSGGCLAAGLTLLARDRGGPALVLQHLSTPVLDDRLETDSMAAFTDTPIWNRRLAQESWELYLGGRAELPAHAAPARAADLRGLPPAYISTAGLDPLRDEGLLYGLRLARAGVPVEVHNFPGAYHAFGGWADGPGADGDEPHRVALEHLTALRRGLHAGGPGAI
ncbi:MULTISPECIES: alpha/beta hydrolase [unclassified Streptomyces]|uniref:alpha/beta hydrolase n=1 Tax=unclassified Streptomyces TaxID=2593676 RepID=UPI002ED39612|nr:alpha/beta hydrolase [Streptomyces sp. NBC_00891]WSY04089.1 alpha/beta hydrolase [Streptomyces sp. NBC_00890]WSZ05715.1 alpha/beta hydrolase [Streptomyces sp. NBC_00869]WSZ26789.1 alpha/beta hydrolase [Streptomyces sp. NBC_00870]